jgi:hypothetical protein
MTAIRDAGPATVVDGERATDDDPWDVAGGADDRVVVEPPPHPATDPTRTVIVTIHFAP